MATDIYKKALALLANREHSREELKRKLLQRGYVISEIKLVLDNLEKENLQSDVRYAEAYVYSRCQKGYGPERIRLELQQKGISENLIEAALESSETDWTVLAEKIYQKKFGNTSPEDFQEKVKRQQFMRYRGFNS